VSVARVPEVNAFALPGGRIVVFDGLLKTIDRPEQLAALLAHEASHVEMRHSTRAVFREMANSLFFSLLFGDFGAVSQMVGQQSQYLNQLSYSRRLEMEADAQGIQWMRQSSLPIAGMRDLFQKMKNSAPSAGQPDVPNFLSTHPSLDDRIQRIEGMLGEEKITAESIPAAVQQAWQELRSH
ncbi:MAG TPA: M48 family metallopeptidase, partial [Saprospiraceae bacterium]|nr:M48 family metallopeptidase [Saprospiraceae bacterium]